jgi:hypothetical protein
VSGSGVFLQTDPIPGGSANNYDYANQDPINNYDLSGTCSAHGHGFWQRRLCSIKHVAGNLGVSANAGVGAWYGVDISVSASFRDGFSLTWGTTHANDLLVGAGASGGLTYQSHKSTASHGECVGLDVVGGCKDTNGVRQYSAGFGPGFLAGGYHTHTVSAYRFWDWFTGG